MWEKNLELIGDSGNSWSYGSVIFELKQRSMSDSIQSGWSNKTDMVDSMVCANFVPIG